MVNEKWFENKKLPTEIGMLVNLTDLQLEENSLSGQIPTTLGLLTNLQSIL